MDLVTLTVCSFILTVLIFQCINTLWYARMLAAPEEPKPPPSPKIVQHPDDVYCLGIV